MARNLLPERNIHPGGDEIRYYCYTPALDGRIVCVYSNFTGAAWDDPNAEVGPPQGTLAECIPAGCLFQEVIEFDNTRYSRDMSDFEIIIVGSKVNTVHRGWYHTRCIAADADASLANKPAYFDINGDHTTTAGSVCIGSFLGERDANGFACVAIDIPRMGRQAGL